MSGTIERLQAELAQLFPDLRTAYLFSEIEPESAERLCRELQRLSKERRKITLVINSPGGYLDDCMAICDMIAHCGKRGAPVTGIVLGQAASAAVAVLQAAQRRLVSERATLMLHSSNVTVEDYLSQAHDAFVNAKRYWSLYLELIAARSSFTPKQLDKKLLGRELYFGAEEAVEAGLADGIF